MPARDIAAQIGVTLASLKYWAKRNRVSLARPMPARDIACAIGVTVPSLRSWCKRKGVSLARPASRTVRARYNALRQAAHRAGLRRSMQQGRVSLWVSVCEGMTVAEAERFLRHASRVERFEAVEDAYDRWCAFHGGPPRAV